MRTTCRTSMTRVLSMTRISSNCSTESRKASTTSSPKVTSSPRACPWEECHQWVNSLLWAACPASSEDSDSRQPANSYERMNWTLFSFQSHLYIHTSIHFHSFSVISFTQNIINHYFTLCLFNLRRMDMNKWSPSALLDYYSKL